MKSSEPASRRRVHTDRLGPREDGVGQVVFVEGGEDDDLVAGIDGRHDGGHHRFGGAAGDRLCGRPASMGIPMKRLCFAARASRKFWAPQVTAYWWGPSMAARAAASSRARGGSKSGKPWERLMAPWPYGDAGHAADHRFAEGSGFLAYFGHSRSLFRCRALHLSAERS